MTRGFLGAIIDFGMTLAGFIGVLDYLGLTRERVIPVVVFFAFFYWLISKSLNRLGEDIRFLKTSFNDVKKKEDYIINSTGFIIAGVLPFALSFVVIGWKRKYDKLHGNVVLLRYQKAQKIAKTRLKTAKKLMDSQNHKEFYTELSSALFGYLEDKLHIPKSEFTVERASDELRRKNLTEELIADLKTGAEKCEFVRFAPGAEKSAAMQEMYDEIADVIINLEKNISVGTSFRRDKLGKRNAHA